MGENNEDILKRLTQLEEEIRLLKSQQAELLAGRVFGDESKKVVQQSPIKEKVCSTPEWADSVEEDEESRQQRSPIQPRKEFDLEKMLGTWLPRVFMFILLLGVLWGLKIGMDNGFITDSVRIVLGYAGTALLYYLGMKYYNNKNTVFGLTLLGGLIALGILTTFAAHHLYGFFSFTVAFIIGLAYIIVGVLLSEKTKSETLTVFSAIGGFLLPFLLDGEGATSFQFCAYILILFLSLFYVSLRQKQKYTFYITFLLFHMTLLIYGVLSGVGGNESILVGTVLIQHLSLLLFYLRGKISRSTFTEALIYSNFVFALGWIKLLEANLETVVYGFLAFVYVAKAMYFLMKKDEFLGGVLSAVAVFALSAFVLSFSFESENIKLLLLLVNGTVGLWVGLRFNTNRTIVTSAFIYVVTAFIVFQMGKFTSFFSLDHAVWVVFLATIVFIYYSIYKLSPPLLKGKMKKVDQSLIVGQVIAVSYIFRLTDLALLNSFYAFQTVNHIYGLVLIVMFSTMYLLFKWSRGKYVIYAVIIEFLILGLLMMTFGLSGYLADSGFLFNLLVEVIYVAVLTVLFIAIMKDRFYIEAAKLKIKLPTLAFIMQIVFFIFLNKWYLSIASFYAWELEYLLLLHTLFLFAFSFVSISIGRKLNWRYVKAVGAVLIVVCVLKLFIVDLGMVSILIRAILFTIIGLVGLLYSKTLFKE